MGCLDYLLSSALELVYPERCTLCRAVPGEAAWCTPRETVVGLRFWDRPHLCRSCLSGLAGEVVTGTVQRIDRSPLPVTAACSTNEDLVRLVGAWKYHGLRGTAWPLATLMNRAADLFPDDRDSPLTLVPIPLHAARARARGFNQAAVLARLLAVPGSRRCSENLLARIRSTGQQAKLTGVSGRTRNVGGAFRAVAPTTPLEGAQLVLVDDLVTSGATVSAAASALEMCGWRVSGVLALGLARSGSEAG